MSTAHIETAPGSSKAKLAIFWLYVMIPLAWGVVNTISQAVKLFK
jgi:site-specific recombinase